MLTLAVATFAAALLPTAAARAAPSIGLAKTLPPTVLFGADIPVTLTASNPAGQVTGYNLSFRDVLPRGVSYAGATGTTPAPTVIANQPATGQTTLVWENLADLAAGGSYPITFKIRASTTSGDFEVGSTVPDTANAYVSDQPRVVPAFTTAGAPTGNASGTATAMASTRIAAIDIAKSGPGALLRGVHDHQYEYTLTTTNNGVRATNGVTVEDYLPAGLEFLGCGGVNADNTTDSSTNPGSAEEYPGSGPISVPVVAGCRTPTRVETVTTDPDGAGPRPTGVYTRVTWAIGDLAANTTNKITYRAAVPIRENTTSFGGTAPSATSLRQAANLDNNSGPETADEQDVSNTATASGTYQRPGAPEPTSDLDTHAATAEDLVLGKSGSSESLVVGAVTKWTLTATASEYRSVDDIRLTDVVPDGLCPLGTSNFETPDPSADCAPGPNASDPYSTNPVEANDGTWTLKWDKSTVPGLAHLKPNASTPVVFSTRTRTRFQRNKADAGPVLAGDSVLNTASVLGKDYTRCSSSPTDCTTTGTKIFHQEIDGIDDVDAASAGQSSTGPSIEKTTARPATGGSCTGVAYAKTVLRYVAGDRVCFKLRVSFPAETSTGTKPLVDFLPPNVTYDATLAPALTGADTLGAPAGPDTTDAAGGVLRWTLGTAPQTTPAAGKVFEVTFAGRVTGPGTYADGAVTGNLMKFTSVDTKGNAAALRDRVDLEESVPLTLLKGVASVNGSPNPASAPNRDGVQVEGGDVVTYRVDLTNAADRPATAEVWDLLPTQISCAQLSTIGDGGACTTIAGGRSVVQWSGVTVPARISGGAAGTKTLTYRVAVPTTFAPGTTLTNTAGVRTYVVTANTGAPFTYVPASNIDSTTPAASINAPAARDDSNVRLRGATVSKTATTSVNETGNTSGQATIGEVVTYTVTATIPKNTAFTASPSLTDVVPSQLTLDQASVKTTTSSGPAPTSSFDGTKLTAALPANYTSGAADVTFTLSFEAVVNDAAGNARGGTVQNTARFNFTDSGNAAQSVASNTTTTTLVEPQVSVSKANDAAGVRVSAGQVVGYTVTARNANASNVSTANDAAVVDTVPAGLTPLKAGSTTDPAADGDVVGTVGATSAGTWDATTRRITWKPTLTPGAAPVLSYRARVDGGVVGGAALTNTVALTSSSIAGTVTGERTTGTNYSASASSSVTSALPTIAKTVLSPASGAATVGQLVRYQVDVVVPADERFYDASVRDVLPDDLGFVGYVSATCVGGCDITPSPYTPAPPATGATTLAWYLGDLDPSASARTVRLVYEARVLPQRRGTGTVVGDADVAINTATLTTNRTDKVTGTPAAPPTTGDDPQSSTKTVVIDEPKLTVDKSVGGQVADSDALTAQPGQTLSYTVKVKNTGTSSAYDATVSDTPSARLQAITPDTPPTGTTVTQAPGAITWKLGGPIAPGDTVTLTYTAKLAASGTLDDGDTALNSVDVSPYFNLAATEPTRRSYDDVTPDVVTVTADLPTLQTTKTTGAAGTPDQADARIGVAFPWRVEVKNTGTVARAVGVDAIDVLPAGWAYVAGSGRIASPAVTPSTQVDPAVVQAAGGDTLTWLNTTDLAPGETLVVSFDAVAGTTAATTPAAPAANPNTNSARATASDATGATGSKSGPYASNTDTAQAVLRAPVLAVTKTPDGGAATAGAPSSFSIKVQNTGNAPATLVDVTDVLPTGLRYTAGKATASPTAGFSETSVAANTPAAGQTRVSWRIASIPAGDAVTIAMPVDVDAAVDPGTFTNTVTAVDAERPTTTPSDTGSLAVVTRADMEVTKTSDPTGQVVPGQKLTYRLVAKNNGPSDARGVQLSDPLPSGTTFDSYVAGQSGTTCSVDAGTVTCTLGRLAPGDIRTVEIVVVVARTQTAALSNTATVSTTTTDPVPGNNTSTATTTVAPTADLSVVKTVDQSSVLEGQTVDFTLAVHNDGPSTAVAAKVIDTLPAGMTYVSSSPACTTAPGANGTTTIACTLGDLAKGADRSIRVTARVDVGALGKRTNAAEVSSSTIDLVPTNDKSSADVTSSPASDVQVTKTSVPATGAVPGQKLTYHLVVENNGPSEALAVQLTDALPAGTTFSSFTAAEGTTTCTSAAGTVTCTLGRLPADETRTIDIVVDVVRTQTATLSNTAEVSTTTADTNAANDTSTTTTTIAPTADLSVVKRASRPVVLEGQVVDYTLAVHNDGPSTAIAAKVVDTLPAGMTYVSSSPACTTAPGADGTTTITCTLGDLLDGADRTIRVTARADIGSIGTRTNVAVVSSTTADPDPADDTGTADVIAGPAADLSVVKTAPATTPAGEELTYTLEVTNNGPSPAQEAQVADVLPAGTAYVRSSTPAGSCAEQAGTVTCRLGTLAGTSTVRVLITVRVPLTLADRTLSNAASVSADNGDPEPANNTSTANTTVGPVTDLVIAKSGPARANPGQGLTYGVTVTNRGPSTATGVSVEDALPAGLSFVSAQPAQGSCSASGQTVRCALGTLAPGGATQVLVTAKVAEPLSPRVLTNAATVTGAEPDPAPADNTASASTTISGDPVGTSDLAITKTASTKQPKLGGEVTYTLVATNAGPETATAATVTDTLPAALRFVSATTTQGTCSGTRVVVCKLGDVPVGTRITVLVKTTVQSPGPVQNTASISAANPDASPADDQAVVGVNASGGSARVTVVKKADRRRVAPGKVVRWTMTAKNTSKLPALAVTVCDRIPAQLTLVSAGGGTVKNGTVCWKRARLEPGATMKVTLRTRLLRGTKARRVLNGVTVKASNARTVVGRAGVAVDRSGRVPRRASGVTG